MAKVRATDLPEGTVVGTYAVIHIKTGPNNWASTNGNRPRDIVIDEDIAQGATVLRHGYGEGE